MLSLSTVVLWLKSKKVILLLLLILAIGSFLRFYDLGAESLWGDEAHSVVVSLSDIPSLIAKSTAGSHLPLYFIILHFWINLFGISEVAIRALSAIFGVLSILATYGIGCLLFNRKVGLIGSFLCAISFYHIQYSQEARPYALLLFLSLLSFLFFIQILKRDNKWNYLGYLLASILLVYNHVFGLLVIAVQVSFLLLFWAKYSPQRLKLIAIQAAAVIALLPGVVIISHRAVGMVTKGFWVPEPTLSSMLITVFYFAGRRWEILLIFFCLAAIAPFAIQGIGHRWSLRKPLASVKSLSRHIRVESVEEILLLVMWLILPILLAFIISKVIMPVYVSKYLIWASPALYLLVAKGLSNLRVKWVIYPVLLIIVLLGVPRLERYYANYQKPQWRDVTAFVEFNSRENDVILYSPRHRQRAFDYYYRTRYHGELEAFGIGSNVSDAQEIAALVNEAISGKERLWLILFRPEPDQAIEAYLIDKYGDGLVIIERDFHKLRVLLFICPQRDPGS